MKLRFKKGDKVIRNDLLESSILKVGGEYTVSVSGAAYLHLEGYNEIEFYPEAFDLKDPNDSDLTLNSVFEILKQVNSISMKQYVIQINPENAFQIHDGRTHPVTIEPTLYALKKFFDPILSCPFKFGQTVNYVKSDGNKTLAVVLGHSLKGLKVFIKEKGGHEFIFFSEIDQRLETF